MAVSTIKPAGGGDFTTLAAWQAAKAASTGVEDALCFAGNLGSVTLDSTFQPSSSLISADASARHNGINSGSGGLAAPGIITILSRGNITVDGLYFPNTGRVFVKSNQIAANNVLIDSNLFVRTSGTQGQVNVILDDAGQGGEIQNFVARNNVIYCTGGTAEAGNSLNVVLTADTVATLVSLAFYNNSGYGGANERAGFSVSYANTGGASWSATIELRNNALFHYADFGYLATGSGTPPTFTSSNNASEDATADDFGGSGHLISQDPNLWWNTPATDASLKSGSPGQNTGITIASFAEDIVNVVRPQFAVWDIGCFESLLTPLSAGLKKLIQIPWVF